MGCDGGTRLISYIWMQLAGRKVMGGAGAALLCREMDLSKIDMWRIEGSRVSDDVTEFLDEQVGTVTSSGLTT
jgi:hypothetical protein